MTSKYAHVLAAGVLCYCPTERLFLLGRRAQDGYWSIPGGLLQPKERTYAGALREFYEETGISLGHSNISYQGYNRLAGDDSKHFAIFLCHVHESFDALLDPEEFTEGGWFSARDLPEPLYPGLLPFIKQHTPMKRETYSPRLCNKPHRLDDGKPIKHKCYVMPTEYLIAEKRGDKARADEIVAGWKKRRRHNGVNG